MEDGTPSLEVGFAIETGGSFEALAQLAAAMDTTEAKILREAQNIENATSGMINLAGSTASVTTFGSATTKSAQDAARALAAVEKAGESLSRQMDKQNATFGMSREQIRAMKVETTALAAEQKGLTELAERLRMQQQQLAAAEAEAAQRAREEADAVRQAGEAYRAFNTYAAQKMTAYRDQQAAETAQAASADKLRSRIDPLFTAQKRYDEEVKTAGALLKAKVIEDHEHAAAVAASGKALDEAKKALEGHTSATGFNRIQVITAQSAVLRFTDSVIAGRNPLTAFALEAHKGVEVLSEDDGGMAGGLKKVMSLLTPVNIGIAAAAAVVIAATAAWYAYAEAVAHLSGIAQGAGVVLGESGPQLEANAEAASAAGNMTVSAARDIEKSYLGIARSGDVLVDMTAITRDFAAATGQDAKQATAELGRMFADPIRGAQELSAQYGVLTAAQVEHIAKLVEEGDKTGAQIELSKAVGKAFDGAADKAEGYAGSLHHITVMASEAYTAVGKFLNSNFGVGSQGLITRLTGYRLPGQQVEAPATDQSAARKAAFQARADDVVRGYQHDNRPAIQETVSTLKDAISAGGSPDQLKAWTEALAANEHALNTWRPAAEKANLIAAATTKVRQATTPAARAEAKAELDRVKAIGEVVTAQNVELRALDRAEGYHNRANAAGARHAETLAREASAQEAQIKNLYAVADAYKVSGAAALIAEAREKAQSQAIKQGADQDAAIDRQIRITIAQRVADAEKSASALRDQAGVQADVNAEVANGNIPAERAADLVRDRMADLPLLAAIEAAQQRGLKAEAEKATKALEDQQDAQKKVDAARIGNFFAQADAAGDKQLAQLQTELSLVGATDAVRTHTLAVLKATQDATAQGATPGAYLDGYVAKQAQIADSQQALKEKQDSYNDALAFTADKWDLIARNVQNAGSGMEDAFGAAGKAIGDLGSIYANYHANQARLDQAHAAQLKKFSGDEAATARENAKFALQSSGAQVGAFADAAEAAKGFFSQGSAGYKALQTAEMAFRAVQFALSLRAIAQDAIETGSSIANSVARTGTKAVEAVVSAISSLPFPLNLAAGAATIAALAGIGVAIAGSFGGGSHKVDPGDTGTGTVLGDSSAKSDSIKNAVDALKQVDLLTNSYSREMAASLKSIDSQISGVAAQIVKGGDAATGASVATGFKPNVIGSVLGAIPLIGGFLSSLFGSKTEVTASGLYGSGQTLGSILAGGFKGQTYSDVEKTSKFFGITTGHSYSTKYGTLDPSLQNQFTLILKSFDDAILKAAGPLGEATSTIQNRLNSFVVNIGKIDLKGLTGTEIQDKLNAVFGAAADDLAKAAFPGIEQFQKVGEGLFETLVRVSSTVEAVTTSLDELGTGAQTLSTAAKLGLADQFDSVSSLTSAVDGYFTAFYSQEEQAAAKTAQFSKVFASLGLAMPDTLAGFRQLVEAQDLTTAAGQATYATLLQLAPAFADLKTSLDGVKSSADIASERLDLQRQLLELQGNTAAVHALDLAKIDPSNRVLQEQVWAVQDAQDAAKAASDLADAWKSVGDSIMDEVKRIRGLNDTAGDGSFASLMGQFNAATAAARGGDQDAAKSLPQLSQSLLIAAASAATSRQELDRIQAQTAASLEATYGVITALAKGSTPATPDTLSAAAAASQAATTPAAPTDDTASEIKGLRDDLAALRADVNAGNATIAGNTGKVARILDNVTAPSGGEAITVAQAA